VWLDSRFERAGLQSRRRDNTFNVALATEGMSTAPTALAIPAWGNAQVYRTRKGQGLKARPILSIRTTNTKGSSTMAWTHGISYFFGGLFLANAVPHYISGIMGSPFQSPFAKPPGKGLSSSTVNVLWGFFNLVVAYILLCRVGDFNLRSAQDVAVSGLGILLMGMMLARSFGRFHGGNAPTDSRELH
jgi:hypothetical protein